MIKYNSSSFDINVDSTTNEDYCTSIETSLRSVARFRVRSHRCDDNTIRAYPLCRLIRMFHFISLN